MKRTKNILNQYQGVKIGITGSFGKTTTKFFMKQILECYSKTFATPQSYNTPLGISKAIEHHFISSYSFLIFEFGATKQNDIEYLNSLVNPQVGIVTEVGSMHLDSFHSIEHVLNEKMKVINHLPENGIGMVYADNSLIRNYPVSTKALVLSFGFEYGTYQVKDIVNGEFDLYKKGVLLRHFVTNLDHKLDIKNLIPSLILVDYYGLDYDLINNQLMNLKKENHRLVKRRMNGFTLLDDSYNSNLLGSLEAIEYLLTQPGKHFVITPGFVENGCVEQKENIKFSKALGKCDGIILVYSKNALDLYERLKDLNANVFLFDSFKKGYNFFKKIPSEKCLLIENDLPDIYMEWI